MRAPHAQFDLYHIVNINKILYYVSLARNIITTGILLRPEYYSTPFFEKQNIILHHLFWNINTTGILLRPEYYYEPFY